ncbi:hypothetical protein [Nonomuraea bangladeshensis]|uniref:hypothetical protein n=1 Tax=Nonomuraea bangladeshensis TaxID=404385 RepID=UPI003C2E6227
MTSLGEFNGGDQIDIIKRLERRIEALEAQVRERPGAPVTKASTAFTIPSASAGSPDDGATLYYDGANLRYVDDAGRDKAVGGSKAPFVSALSGSVDAAPASYTSGWGGQVTSSINVMAPKINSIINALIIGELMNPS